MTCSAAVIVQLFVFSYFFMGGGVEFKWMRLEPEEVGKTLRVVEMETNADQR